MEHQMGLVINNTRKTQNSHDSRAISEIWKPHFEVEQIQKDKEFWDQTGKIPCLSFPFSFVFVFTWEDLPALVWRRGSSHWVDLVSGKRAQHYTL